MAPSPAGRGTIGAAACGRCPLLGGDTAGVEAEILIVGGGVAGLAVAARLAPLRRSVVVVDKSARPRDKVCGEGLMPMGLEALRLHYRSAGATASALLAAETVKRMFGEPTRRALWERQFDTGRRILFQHFSDFDKIFRSAIRTSPGSELLLWGMRKWPEVAESVLDIVATGHPWKTFDAPALLAPLAPWRRARRGVDDRTIPHGAEIGSG